MFHYISTHCNNLNRFQAGILDTFPPPPPPPPIIENKYPSFLNIPFIIPDYCLILYSGVPSLYDKEMIYYHSIHHTTILEVIGYVGVCGGGTLYFKNPGNVKLVPGTYLGVGTPFFRNQYNKISTGY